MRERTEPGSSCLSPPVTGDDPSRACRRPTRARTFRPHRVAYNAAQFERNPTGDCHLLAAVRIRG